MHKYCSVCHCLYLKINEFILMSGHLYIMSCNLTVLAYYLEVFLQSLEFSNVCDCYYFFIYCTISSRKMMHKSVKGGYTCRAHSHSTSMIDVDVLCLSFIKYSIIFIVLKLFHHEHC